MVQAAQIVEEAKPDLLDINYGCPVQKVVCKLAGCLLYTSDAADDLHCVDLGARRILKKKKKILTHRDYAAQDL